MTDKVPADWVLIEAAKRCNWDADVAVFRSNFHTPYGTAFRALCHMIEKYEQPPVDRKVLCAREVIQEAVRARVGWSQEDTCIRAIELWEEGYGSDKIDH